MPRPLTTGCTAALLAAWLSPLGASAQRSDADLIAEALAAAPEEISSGATVLEWPATEGGEFRLLRQGTNGWTCLPDPPDDRNFESMCNDAEWMEAFRAIRSGHQPRPKRMGLSYMLSSRWSTSNLDPAATSPTSDNEWVEGGAHLMVIVPDPAMLEHFPDDPGPGPYVMWKGTPLAHLMIPMESLVKAPGG